MTPARLAGWALALAAWTLLVDHDTLATLAAGIPIAFGAVVLFERAMEIRPDRAHGWRWLGRVGRYLVRHVLPDLLESTVVVFRKVLSRDMDFAPAILQVSLPSASPEALTVLAYGIALTPVQQVVEVDADRRILYVHVLDGRHPETVRAGIVKVFHDYLEEV